MIVITSPSPLRPALISRLLENSKIFRLRPFKLGDSAPPSVSCWPLAFPPSARRPHRYIHTHITILCTEWLQLMSDFVATGGTQISVCSPTTHQQGPHPSHWGCGIHIYHLYNTISHRVATTDERLRRNWWHTDLCVFAHHSPAGSPPQPLGLRYAYVYYSPLLSYLQVSSAAPFGDQLTFFCSIWLYYVLPTVPSVYHCLPLSALLLPLASTCTSEMTGVYCIYLHCTHCSVLA